MLRQEAPGAQDRGSPLLWMEGEPGEDGRPGAGGGGWRKPHPRGTGRLRRQLDWARFFPARNAEPGRHRPPRAHPSLCLLLAREPRFRGASPGRLSRVAFWLPAPIRRSRPSPGQSSPLGSWGPALPRCWYLSGTMPAEHRRDPVRGSAGTAWPSGLLHRAHSGCQRLILPALARGPDRTARRGPRTPSPTRPSWSLP